MVALTKQDGALRSLSADNYGAFLEFVSERASEPQTKLSSHSLLGHMIKVLMVGMNERDEFLISAINRFKLHSTINKASTDTGAASPLCATMIA